MLGRDHDIEVGESSLKAKPLPARNCRDVKWKRGREFRQSVEKSLNCLVFLVLHLCGGRRSSVCALAEDFTPLSCAFE
jgi:hypothetical protein